MKLTTLYGFSGDSVVEALSIANTPSFLFSQLRSDTTVIALAKRASFDELNNALRQHVIKDSATLEDMALAYAYLMAMTLQNSERASHVLNDSIYSRLRWAGQLVASVSPKWEKTNVADFRFPAILSNTLPSSNGSSNTVTMTLEAK
jgi:hypothetical protein